MAITDTSHETDAEAPAAPPPEPPDSQAPARRAPGSADRKLDDHKLIGQLHLALALLFLLVGGAIAMILRTQLAAPDLHLVTNLNDTRLLTLHGTYTVFLFLLPAWIGLATVLVPLQIGATRLAFPRLAPLALGLFTAGGGMVLAAPLVKGRVLGTGWTLGSLVARRAQAPGKGPELLMLGLIIVAAAVIVAAINIIATIVLLRAPGLTLRRVPPFTFSVLVSSAMLLLATPVLSVGLGLLLIDHHYGGRVFDASQGGNPLVWARLFWFFAYPAMWALVLPAFGVLGEIVPVFTRTRLGGNRGGHSMATGAMVAIGALAFAGWGSQLPGDPSLPRWFFSATSLAILAPAFVLILTCLTSLRLGRPQLGAPLLGAIALASVALLGLPGAAIAAVAPTSRMGNGTYWTVAVQHSLFFGGATIGLLAAIAYWAPKLWGRRLPEGAAVAGLGGVLLGSLVMNLSMYVLGLQQMPRHTPRYPTHESWRAANVVATGGGFVLGLGLLAFLAGVTAVVVRRRGTASDGEPSGAADPWQGHTLEWTTTSPPPPHNFDVLPEVRSERPLLDLVGGGAVG
jgi:heme/copper-type cytochrome/quinol oxidase subunit 1